MPQVRQIFERKDILPYLEARSLLNQYLKAKQYLLAGRTLQVKFKERNPMEPVFGVFASTNSSAHSALLILPETRSFLKSITTNNNLLLSHRVPDRPIKNPSRA